MTYQARATIDGTLPGGAGDRSRRCTSPTVMGRTAATTLTVTP